MPFNQLEDLPQEVKQLPNEAQQVFMAAYNSIEGGNGDSDTALNVAWTTVKRDYHQGEDGQWQRIPQDDNNVRGGVQSGGN